MIEKNVFEILLRGDLDLRGLCDTKSRRELIEEAISGLQKDPETWAKTEYYGLKNYAQWSDQRSDHSYGCGPRHGSICFRIGRGYKYVPENAELYIQTLLYFRDFKGPEDMTLPKAVSAYDKSKKDYEFYTALLEKQEIES